MTRTLPKASETPTSTYSEYRHFKRVMRYTRPSDWGYGAAAGALSPGLMLYWEKVSPSFVGKGGFAPIMRLSGAVGLTGMFVFAYSRSCSTFGSIFYTLQSHRFTWTQVVRKRLLTYTRSILRNQREPP
jgi:hypothetical protein